MSSVGSWVRRQLGWLVEPYFWAAFIPVVAVKFVVFAFAAEQYLAVGYHPLFGMEFSVVEGYSDFTYYYMNFVHRFVQGHLPYTDGLYAINGVQVYIYPPFFVYILGAFYFIPTEVLFPNLVLESLVLGRSLDFLRVGFAFIFFDIATCAVIYLTTKRLTANRFLPMVIMLLFALNPISLWWGNYLWLSTPIHTFFLVVGFYYFVRGNLLWAAIWITVATMVKQTAALLLPIVLLLELRHGFNRFFTTFAVVVALLLVFSLPYIALYPFTYFYAVLAGLGPYRFYDALPSVTSPVPVSVLAIGWPEPFKFIAINAVFYAVPWIGFLTLFWVAGSFIVEHPEHRYQDQLLLIALLLSLASHIFLARGIYKFYLIAILPYFVLFSISLNHPIIPRFAAPQGGTARQRICRWLVRFGNNWATLWCVFVLVLSVGIFFIDRYYTHLLLLSAFVPLLSYGGYRYLWFPRKQRQDNHHTQEASEGAVPTP